jgi:hypothetical protein
MEICYTNTLDHLVSLQKYVLRHTAFGRRMMLHRFIAVEIVILFIAVLFAINHNPLKVLLGLAIVSGLAWVFRERSVLLQFKRDFKRERRKDEKRLFDKRRRLEIMEDGIVVDIGGNRNRYRWDEVETVGMDRRHIYIVMTGVLHYVIPLSAFPNPGEAGRFMETIQHCRAS